MVILRANLYGFAVLIGVFNAGAEWRHHIPDPIIWAMTYFSLAVITYSVLINPTESATPRSPTRRK